MDSKSQLHTPAALTLGKKAFVAISYEAEWAPKSKETKSYLTRETRRYSTASNFGIYFPITVKLGTGGMHIVLFCIREFRENRRREGQTFVVDGNELTFMCTPSDGTIFQRIEGGGVFCVLRHRVRHLPSCWIHE
jgi:hypothetical protein